MATKKDFRITKRSPGEFQGFEIELKEIIDIIKKGPAAMGRKGLSAKSLRNALEQMPIHYLDEVSNEKLYLDKLIGIVEKEIKDGTYQANSKLETLKKIQKGEEGVVWNSIKNLREDLIDKVPEAGFIKGETDIGHKNVSNAVLWYTLLEKYLPTNIDRTFIKKAKAIAQSIDKIQPDARILQEIGFKPGKLHAKDEEIKTYINLMNNGFTYETNTILEQVLSGTNAKVKFTVSLEPRDFNRYTGALTAGLGKAIRSHITQINSGLKEYIEKQTNKFPNIKASPSMLKFIDDFITNTILGKSTKSIKKKTKSVDRKEIKGSGKFKAALKKFNSIKIRKTPRIPTETFDYLGLMQIINENLAEKIRSLMGDSSDPAIKLRTQTGRFSESAKLLTLTRQQTGLLYGTYTYQRDPYDVFLPGGRLNPPKERDPKIYIEGAVREIAMAILKRRFPGIQLGLQ